MKYKVVKRCKEDLSSMHELLKSFLPFAQKKIGFNKPPVIYFQSDDSNAKRLLGKTAYYDPMTMGITLYVTGRHPKDVMRSLSHELVHHGQNCRGEFNNIQDLSPGYAQSNDHLRDMELQAYKDGNIFFRDWEDAVKTGKIKVNVSLQEAAIPVAVGKTLGAIGRSTLDVTQVILMGVGMADFLGPLAMGADFLNMVIFILRGRWIDALFSFLFIWPGLGWIIPGAYGIGKAGKFFSEAKKSKIIKDVLQKAGKNPDDVVKGGQKLFDEAIAEVQKLSTRVVSPERKKEAIKLLGNARESWAKNITSVFNQVVGGGVVAGVGAGTAIAVWSSNSGYKSSEEEGSTETSIPRDKGTAELYTVVAGDSLSLVSRKEYGDAQKWPLIYRANSSTIGPDPDYLRRTGPDGEPTVLIIPAVLNWEKMTPEEISDIRARSDGRLTTGARKSGAAAEEPKEKEGVLSKLFRVLGIFESKYTFPIREEEVSRISSHYGMRGPIHSLSHKSGRYSKRSMHRGLDIPAEVGTDVLAPHNGKIVKAFYTPGTGYALVLRDDKDLTHRFLHLSGYKVRVSDRVKRGQVIAKSGNTGYSSGPHLHYDVEDVKGGNYNSKGGKFDPLELFKHTSIPMKEWKNTELNRLLVEKFNLGEKQ